MRLDSAERFVLHCKFYITGVCCLSVYRLKDPTYVVNAFNVDPLYLKHDQQGSAPDYRVSKENLKVR